MQIACQPHPRFYFSIKYLSLSLSLSQFSFVILCSKMIFLPENAEAALNNMMDGRMCKTCIQATLLNLYLWDLRLVDLLRL